MTSDRERFEFSSEKREEIAEFRLFLRISGQKSLGRLFYQNNLPNMRQDSGNHTIRRFLPPSGGWVQTTHHLVFWYFIFILIKMKE